MKEFLEKLINGLEASSCWEQSTFDADGYCNDDGEEIVYLHTAIDVVNEVAKEYTNSFIGRWIPVSEQLPEGSIVSCLVTLKNGAVVPANYIVDEFVRHNTYGDIKPFYKNNPVIAWTPMPKGYCPEETEDEEE